MVIIIKINKIFQQTISKLHLTNAQSAGLHTTWVAAERALQQPMQQMRNAVSKGPPVTFF